MTEPENRPLQKLKRAQRVTWGFCIFFLAGLVGIQIYRHFHPSTPIPPQPPCLDKVVEIPGSCDHPQHSGSVIITSSKYFQCTCTHGL